MGEPKPEGGKERLATTTLPNADEMLRRLRGVDQWPALMNNFYPALLEAAGATLNSHGVVMLLLNGTAVMDQKVDPRVSTPLYGMIPNFIDALVDDKAIASEAKNYWEELQQQFAEKKKGEA